MSHLDRCALAPKLIGDMDIRRFNSEIRERRSAKFVAAFLPDSLADLFCMERLEQALVSDRIPGTYADIIRDGYPIRLSDLERLSGEAALDVVLANLKQGASLRISDAQRFDLRLRSLITEAGTLFAARSQANIYLTPPGHAGFRPHFDTTDIFILQCSGSKEWHIHAEYSEQLDLPLLETEWDPGRYRPAGKQETIVLEPGDVLYLPRGTMHDARCLALESLHLTISIAPLTVVDLIREHLLRAAAHDVELRRRVSWSVESSEDELDSIERDIRWRAGLLAQQIDVVGMLQARQMKLRCDMQPVSDRRLRETLAALGEGIVDR